MKTSHIISIFIGAVVIGLIVFMVFSSGDDVTKDSTSNNATSQDKTASDDLTQSDVKSGGELVAYSEKDLVESSSDTNILFFHAEWCSVCKSVERNLEAGSIPEGVTIFKVDFDSTEGQDLADKYKIPIQYAMVQVDNDGNEIVQWVNQSFFKINDILERVKQV